MKTKRRDTSSRISPDLRGLAFRSGLTATVLALLTLCSQNASALGLRIPNQDAEAIARGNAFAATADNPSAVYYNPAGITQLDGTNVQFGVHALSINSTFETPGGAKYHSEFAVQPVPELYATYALTNAPLTFGLGVFAPFGMGIQWPEESPFRNSSAYHGQLYYVTVNPVVAWKILDQLSIAIGPTINAGQILLEQGLAPGLGFKYRGMGSSFGYTTGIRWQPLESWSFGAKYHSESYMNFHGSAYSFGSSSGSTVQFPFPQFASGGISYRPTTNWNVEADVDWTDWHALNSVTFYNTPVLGNITSSFKWKSSVMIEAGATRYLDDGYYVSAGYFYSPNSTSQQFFTPVDPDTNLHVGSVGLGHKGLKWDWALAAQLITGPDRTVTGAFDPNVNGKYSWMNGSLDFSLRYRF